ncbi:MAG: TRAP transporter substrate-binding protein [Microcoleus sp.]
MLTELLEVVRIVSEVSVHLRGAGEAKRQRIATYFEAIEKCLLEIVEKLRQGEVPNAQWSTLQTYAQDLQTNNIGQDIGLQEAARLSSLLLRIATNNTPPTNNEISSIENAAGTFGGMAIIIRTNPNPIDPSGGNKSTNTTRRKVLTYTPLVVGGLVNGVFLDKAISQPTPDRNRLPSDAEQCPSVSWEMHAFLGESVKKTILYTAPQQVCDRVRKMTQGRFIITLKRTGQTEEILKKVSAGDIQCAYSGTFYTTPQYKALYFGCAIPFGLNPQEQTAWLHYKKNPNDELTFMQSIYNKLGLNVISFPAGATGGQMGGWFKAKINRPDDLKGKIIRIPGLGADVLRRMGMKNHDDIGKISLDEAIRRLKDGRFFAVEWISPYDDLQLGLNEAAKFYYYPGWWEPSTTFDAQVNLGAWNKLPDSYKEIFKIACHETYTSILTEYDLKNSLALKEIPQKGVELIRFNNDILKAAEDNTKYQLNVYAQQDKLFKEVYDEWRSFKERIRAWSKLTKIE